MSRAHLIAVVAAAAFCSTATPAAAATLCVGDRDGCFDGLQDAVDAAADGDVIRIAPGTYPGGVAIDASITLRGAGAGATRLHGGGPVLTIGAALAPTPPTVQLSGVTISGGVARTGFVPGLEDVIATGGGVLIPPSEAFEPGATVTIADSVIEGNRTAPSATVPSGNAQCPGGPCPFAAGFGGGIYNAGSLTLTRVAVIGNRNGPLPGAPPLASDAEGGGIYSRGSLTLVDTVVSGNEAVAIPPNARFANGGGVLSESGSLTIDGGSISHNRAVLDAAWPSSVGLGNIGGGVFANGDSATIDGARIEDNALVASNSVGDAFAFSGGVHGNGPVVLRDSIVASNHVTATVPPGSSSTASADSGAGNLNAGSTIARSRLVGNTATAVAGAGPAIAAAGALWAWSDDTIDVRDTLIAGNRVTATGAGSVTAHGGGIVNVDALVLRRTHVSQNTVRAGGQSGEAFGGGIWNGRVPESEDLMPQLGLADTAITGNAITAAAGIDVRGGGLFTSEPVALTRVLIHGNRPGQCAGC